MDLKEVKSYFKLLNLPNWQEQGNLKRGGQAVAFEVKNSVTGDLGVFRLLQSKKEIDIKRFDREIKLLTENKYHHKNIVQILEKSNDINHQWYISKRGQPFEEYWINKKLKFFGNLNLIVKDAIEIILSLSQGLELLHSENIVHRDIKPSNIIMQGEIPQLIDFGLVFNPTDERLTPEDSATGNARFSPDQMMNRLEEVPPWLDIFQLSQVLIWMTMEKPSKNWNRPLDWKWLNYPTDFSDENIGKLRCISAICSDFYSSPKTAQDLIKLINSLNKEKIVSRMDTNAKFILESIENKKIQETIDKISAKDTILSEFELVSQIERTLSEAILRLTDMFINPFKVDILTNKRIIEFKDQIITNNLFDFYTYGPSGFNFEFLNISFGIENEQLINLRMILSIQLPYHRDKYYFKSDEKYYCSRFTYYLNGKHLTELQTISPYFEIMINCSGELKISRNDSLFRNPQTVDGFLENVKQDLSNERLWRN